MKSTFKSYFYLFLMIGLVPFIRAQEHKIRRTYSMHPTLELLKEAIRRNDVPQAFCLASQTFPTGLHCQYTLLILSTSEEMACCLLKKMFNDWYKRIQDDPENSIEQFIFGYHLISKECENSRLDENRLNELQLLKKWLIKFLVKNNQHARSEALSRQGLVCSG